MNVNNNTDNFLSLAFECEDDIAIIGKFDINVISIISFRKYNSTYRVLTLMLVDQKKGMSLDEFSRILENLLAENSLDIIAGGFIYDLSKLSSNKLLNHMIGYTESVNKPTNISGSQKAYVYSSSKECFARGVSYKGHCSKHIPFWSWCSKNSFPKNEEKQVILVLDVI